MKQFTVDAFTDKIFGGNLAAVCLLEKILSETAFFVKDKFFSKSGFLLEEFL